MLLALVVANNDGMMADGAAASIKGPTDHPCVRKISIWSSAGGRRAGRSER